MKLDTKDFLTFAELDGRELARLLEIAIQFKKKPYKTILKNKTLAMIFQKPSTRTRISFEVGMAQLGGESIYLSPDDMQLSRGETVPDTARTLSRYVDVIMARVFDHKMLEEMARHSAVPVINGLSNSFHPCQILADLMTIREKKKKLSGLKLAWIGDGNNVCNSMLYGCALSGIDVSVATPRGFRPDAAVVREAKRSVGVTLGENPAAAAADADIVMTDTFASIHNRDRSRSNRFLPKYQVNQKLMGRAKSDAIFMHCLPAKRGQEVTASVIDGPQSVVWDTAENRLHTQKALLASLCI